MTDETTQAEMPAQDAIAPETEQAESSPAIENESSPVENGDDTAPATEAKKPHWSQKRIDELTWNWRQEQREKQQLLEMLQQQKPVEQPKAATPAVKKPELEDFEYDPAKYDAALLAWHDAQTEAKIEKRFAEEEQKRAEQKQLESFASRSQEFAKTNPDYVDKVMRSPTLPIAAEVQSILRGLEDGPEIAYHLVNNQEEALRLLQMPTNLALLEVGRIQGRLSALKEVKTRPVPVVSKAPPPPPRVEDVNVPVSKDPSQMSDAEFAKWRERQIAQRR